MKQTENYQLSQWEKTDRIMMEDFNRDNLIIENGFQALKAALTAERVAREAADGAEEAARRAADAAFGNCRIAMGSYVGDGSYGTAEGTALTFPFEPKLVVIQPLYGACPDVYNDSMKDKVMLLLIRPVKIFYLVGGSEHDDVTWGENSVSWRNTKNAAYEMNSENVTYHYVALG